MKDNSENARSYNMTGDGISERRTHTLVANLEGNHPDQALVRDNQAIQHLQVQLE
jgi:hypothetical protein